MESTGNSASDNENNQNFNPSPSVRGIDVDFSKIRLADIFPNFKYEKGEQIEAKEFNESLGIMVDTVIFQNDIITLTSELYIECHMMSELYSLVRKIEVVGGGQYVVDRETGRRLLVGGNKSGWQEITVYVSDSLEGVIRFCLERGFGVWMN